MITACHTLIYTDDAEATRAFLRDVTGFPTSTSPPHRRPLALTRSHVDLDDVDRIARSHEGVKRKGTEARPAWYVDDRLVRPLARRDVGRGAQRFRRP